MSFVMRLGITTEAGQQNKRTKVVNYVRALEKCLQDVRNGVAIDLKMIRNAHKILMYDVRGQEKQPGEFRTIQNWIGSEGTKIDDATYVPSPPEYMDELLIGLEQFIRSPSGQIPVLIQCAMIHYQFEAIHPFADGNGRIGRLLIPLILAKTGVLEQPLLYLSAYIERNKEKYYSLLLTVSKKSTWVEWIRFFLDGVIAQSNDALNNIQQLMNLKKLYENKLISKKASGSATRLVDYLFKSSYYHTYSTSSSRNNLSTS